MKKLIALALSSVLVYTANAQDQSDQTTTANQSINLALSNVIEVTFTANGLSSGPLVNIPFATINDYVNGAESAPQELRVRSNKRFLIKVRTNSPSFTYSGLAVPAPTMPVENVLLLKVSANNTGGNVHAPFSTVAYANIRDFDQFLLNEGTLGDNKTLSVIYKATPGFAYPAGNYAVDVVYTATQY